MQMHIHIIAHTNVYSIARKHADACIPACSNVCEYACSNACTHACSNACTHAWWHLKYKWNLKINGANKCQYCKCFTVALTIIKYINCQNILNVCFHSGFS